eukprot:gene12543-16909_t
MLAGLAFAVDSEEQDHQVTPNPALRNVFLISAEQCAGLRTLGFLVATSGKSDAASSKTTVYLHDVTIPESWSPEAVGDDDEITFNRDIELYMKYNDGSIEQEIEFPSLEVKCKKRGGGLTNTVCTKLEPMAWQVDLPGVIEVSSSATTFTLTFRAEEYDLLSSDEKIFSNQQITIDTNELNPEISKHYTFSITSGAAKGTEFGMYAKLYTPCVVEMEGTCFDQSKLYCTAPFLTDTSTCIGQSDLIPCCPDATSSNVSVNTKSAIGSNGTSSSNITTSNRSTGQTNNAANPDLDHLNSNSSDGIGAGFVALIVILVLLLLLVVSIYACAHCKAQKERRGQELQHLAHAKAMPETSVNPVFVRPQQTQRRVVVAAMNSLKQYSTYSIPMEELTVNLGVDGEYLEPNAMQMLAYDSLQEGGVLSTVPGANIVLTQATATTPTTPVYATPVQAAASLSLTTVGASQLPGLTPQKDADGYVVDDYTPESDHISRTQSALGVGQHASSNA